MRNSSYKTFTMFQFTTQSSVHRFRIIINEQLNKMEKNESFTLQ